MDLMQSILLHTMWVVHLFFQRLLSNRSDKCDKPPKVSKQTTTNIVIASNKKISSLKRLPKLPKLPNTIKDIIDFESHSPNRGSRMRRGHTISHFLFDEKKTGETGRVDMSDVVSPLEEEMLRLLCAKGVETKRNSYSNPRGRLTKACSEMCIPRDIFTHVWLNSTDPSQA